METKTTETTPVTTEQLAKQVSALSTRVVQLSNIIEQFKTRISNDVFLKYTSLFEKVNALQKQIDELTGKNAEDVKVRETAAQPTANPGVNTTISLRNIDRLNKILGK